MIIAGPRTVKDVRLVLDLIDDAIERWPGGPLEVTEVVNGCAPGVDSAVLMKPWACPVRKMPADWERFGRSAGHRRNADMRNVGDALVAIWDGVSRGTGGMISLMAAAGKPFVVVRVG